MERILSHFCCFKLRLCTARPGGGLGHLWHFTLSARPPSSFSLTPSLPPPPTLSLHPLSLAVCLFLSADVSPSVCLSVCLSLLVCLCIGPPLSLSLSLSLCLSVSVCLFVCLSVCLSLSPPPPLPSLSSLSRESKFKRGRCCLADFSPL